MDDPAGLFVDPSNGYTGPNMTSRLEGTGLCPVRSSGVQAQPSVRAVIVDGWPMIRIGLSRVLGSRGIRTVAEVADAQEALGYLRTASAELLVIGDHGGITIDVVRQALGLSESLRILVLLGSVNPDELRQLLSAGVAGVLNRNVGPDELLDSITRMLTDERVVAPGLLPLLFAGEPSPSGTQALDGSRPTLTPKEQEVTRLLAAGASTAAIAAELYVSQATIKTHLAHIYAKLGASGRHEAVARAVALGVVA